MGHVAVWRESCEYCISTHQLARKTTDMIKHMITVGFVNTTNSICRYMPINKNNLHQRDIFAILLSGVLLKEPLESGGMQRLHLLKCHLENNGCYLKMETGFQENQWRVPLDRSCLSLASILWTRRGSHQTSQPCPCSTC